MLLVHKMASAGLMLKYRRHFDFRRFFVLYVDSSSGGKQKTHCRTATAFVLLHIHTYSQRENLRPPVGRSGCDFKRGDYALSPPRAGARCCAASIHSRSAFPCGFLRFTRSICHYHVPATLRRNVNNTLRYVFECERSHCTFQRKNSGSGGIHTDSYLL